MAVTTTLGEVLVEMADRFGVGLTLREIDPDAVLPASVTLPNSLLQGPVSSKDIPINSGITFVSPGDTGTATASSTTSITDSTKAWVVNEWVGFIVRMGGWYTVITSNTATVLTWTTALDAAPALGIYTLEFGSSRVSDYNPSTGALSMNPSLGTLDAGGAMVKPFTAVVWKEMEHANRIREAVNRALQSRVSRWEYRPLTYVPDGDLQGTTASDYWTVAANGTIAYANAQAFPAGGGVDAVGQLGLNRLLQLTSTGATSVAGNGIRVEKSNAQLSWYFLTAFRLVSGTGTAELKFRDNTNAADIVLQITRGNDANLLSLTTFGDFMVCEGTFMVPPTCAEIAPQLSLSATTMVAQMAPIIMFPLNTMSFPLPNRIEGDEFIGNFFTGIVRRGPGGLNDIEFSTPITTSGMEHHLIDYGDHRTVTFNWPINRPVWYEEAVYGPALNSTASTTTFPQEQIALWAYYELTDRLMRDEMVKGARNANTGAPLASIWRPLRNAALKSAMNSSYEPATKHVLGRR